MQNYFKMSAAELKAELALLREKYNAYKAEGLDINMTRGVPSPAQLALSTDMLTVVSTPEQCISGALDCRNYGCMDGIPEAKAIFADLLGINADNIVVGGNSSLEMMFQYVSMAMTHGVLGSKPWSQLEKVKFICPSPGYDRHFAVSEFFGMELIPVELGEDGPDMDEVERLVNNDSAVKGIWCVPKYSNPTGIIYSDETVKRFAALRPAAEDFRIIWDNAYIVHDFDGCAPLCNIFDECEKTGNINMPVMFASTSKFCFPGAGVAVLCSSDANVEQIRKAMFYRTIGSDKLNQLRFSRFFGSADGVRAHMKKHAALIKPRFDKVLEIFERDLAGSGVATWTRPEGGYFLSLDVEDGCAKRTVQLAAEAGIKLTAAGATYPGRKDPRDRNIRIAPTFPDMDKLVKALEVTCLCARLAALEKLAA